MSDKVNADKKKTTVPSSDSVDSYLQQRGPETMGRLIFGANIDWHYVDAKIGDKYYTVRTDNDPVFASISVKSGVKPHSQRAWDFFTGKPPITPITDEVSIAFDNVSVSREVVTQTSKHGKGSFDLDRIKSKPIADAVRGAIARAREDGYYDVEEVKGLKGLQEEITKAALSGHTFDKGETDRIVNLANNIARPPQGKNGGRGGQ
ncbi:MAG: hypothetical protein K2X09_02455 [Rickettsiales bacterium]|nr:hypothetical protein [Rickettsiales bacterium]